MGPRDANGHGHDGVREQYDETASIFEEGMPHSECVLTEACSRRPQACAAEAKR